MTRTRSLWIIFSFVFGGDGSSFQHQTFNRAKNGSYADFIPYTLEEMYTVSVIKCCTTCTINANCFSVVFNSDSTQCILLTKGISLDAPTKPELPSNIQAFTKPSSKCSDFGYKESKVVNGTCFKAKYDIKTKYEAAIECANDKASLAQIDSASKHLEVLQFIQSETLPGSYFFVDGSDEAIEDDWRLSDGRSMFLDWMYGEPAPCCKGHEDCITIFYDGRMNDVPCVATNTFLCEKRSNDVI